jgi:DMSO/TMAO reductase YedYZ molybdopterin-dependent catalytic subunit
MDRRSLLRAATGCLLAGDAALPRLARADLAAGALQSATLEALPGKKALIKRAYRPPNYETPLSGFAKPITPNDEFFVRWHLANIPEIDAKDWRLAVSGEAVSRPFNLTLDDLRNQFEQVELVAVCQCSGNRRGLSDPHVPGVQWGYGAMGNALWRGVRLKDLLTRAGIRAEAIEIAFRGGDEPLLEATPKFIKSIPIWKALDENTLVAYDMNGTALPHWNGYPARIVIPGWTGTYWMKQVVSIEALTRPARGFWMSGAYRIPKGLFPMIDRFQSQESDTSTPITEMVVNSLITDPVDGARIGRGKAITVSGIAWDGGYGIREVEVSTNGGKSWDTAELGADLGKYSFRPWRIVLSRTQPGRTVIMARASNTRGASQAQELIFNPPGYHNNVPQRVTVDVV